MTGIVTDLATYLVIHTPDPEESDIEVAPPSDLAGLAQHALATESQTRWLGTWTPSGIDDRIFTLWQSEDSSGIVPIMERFNFLDGMLCEIVQVDGWDAESVLKVQAGAQVEAIEEAKQ